MISWTPMPSYDNKNYWRFRLSPLKTIPEEKEEPPSDTEDQPKPGKNMVNY